VGLGHAHRHRPEPEPIHPREVLLGLGRTPAYMKVDIDDHGRTIGLF
jgi:hypothetical protein